MQIGPLKREYPQNPYWTGTRNICSSATRFSNPSERSKKPDERPSDQLLEDARDRRCELIDSTNIQFLART